MLKKIFQAPIREYILAVFVLLGLVLDYFWGFNDLFLGIVAIGALIPLANGIYPLLKGKITIDTFNAFALTISFAAGEIRSSAFIILMLLFAYILNWQLVSRKNRAVEELMRLKPVKAFREIGETTEEVRVEDIKTGDIVVVREGQQIPTDGTVIFGEATVNESLVTGESTPVKKGMGDDVLGSTLNLTGTVKIKTTRVGKDSTIERIATLIEEATKHKSHSEKTADKFAKIFLPIVLVLGIVTYFITRNLILTASLFLVACADDMAVAIPLAMTAAIGGAAKRGVIIKGGEWLDALSKIDTVVIDKTGTLTYGDLRIGKVVIKESIPEDEFWNLVGIAEKLSDHPSGRAIYKEAMTHVGHIPDPDSFSSVQGMGVSAVYGSKDILLGNFDIVSKSKITNSEEIKKEMESLGRQEGMPVNVVIYGSAVIGYILVRDIPRVEAKESIAILKDIGIKKITMFTGDVKYIAENVGREMGISEVVSEMKPETKVAEVEKLLGPKTTLAMIGDGINDAPSLARADVGIAMGGAGTAVTIEAADVIILTDNLNLLPESILLGRKTMSVIRGDMIIWVFSNVLGFSLVFMGFIGPALAAFYNFASDFLPLINSARLFRNKHKGV